MTAPQPPHREVRAVHDERTIRVYQAFNDQIAEAALRAQRFVPPFGMGRMTWIKPSFLWMMYRAGWVAARYVDTARIEEVTSLANVTSALVEGELSGEGIVP